MTPQPEPQPMVKSAAELSPAPVLAALAAVLHRRTLQETVRVVYRDADGEGGVTVEVTENTGLHALTADAGEALLGLVDADDEDTGPGGLADARLEWAVEPRLPARGLTVVARPDRVAVLPGSGPGALSAREAAHLEGQLHQALLAGRGPKDVAVSVLPLLPPDELAEVMSLAGSGVAPVAPRPVHVLVQERAESSPDAVAVTCGDASLTYRGLVRAADALAARLRLAGAGPDQVVGIVAERSLRLVVALLAVLKTGAAYAAFEPDLPAPRLRAQLTAAGARLVLAADGSAVSPGLDVTVLPLSPTDGEHEAGPPVCVRVPPAAAAYVGFTSGSTGEPKPICVPHTAVARLVVEPDWAEFRPTDTFVHLAPMAFDASTLEVWAPLVNGARLVVHPPGRLSVEALAATLVDEGVTVAWMTAGLFHRMVGRQLGAFAGLRHVLAGGDVISAGHVRRLLGTHPHLLFTNGYGPTENTTFTTCWTSREPAAGNTVPLGRPISGTRVLVLDPELNPVPVGVPGELYAGGDGLARGYLGRPAATAERFVPDPFAPVPGARLYRTGDLVRRLADGTLEFLGRADRQLKVRGYRVEPGEIETLLDSHEDVRQAVVIGQDDGSGGKRLLAYVTAVRPGDDSPAELGRRLREWLRGEVPGYLVPWAVLPLPELPLNRNGKVDRAALPAARRAPRTLVAEYTAPRTPTEAAVAEEWADLLSVEPVGVDDDFFELGGHSLIAADLLTRLQERFSVDLPARTLYLRPTVAELAEELREQQAPAPAPSVSAP
ncbi:non-ribosomal peptide synthetase [Streptomyces sp. PTY087I2]|uniref:non-ribosomal peptide synthetase n=1 Tax=Streptomyces sp. PTY087I2 TaxID=1819298 RepID=UPI0008286297|nr:non-ribosomal peptide synthetase [Streptomyces sp. PTY087I2]OCC13532.1 Gramicidin S synthase 2 [Streptomyces sp. PTY087I2]